MHGLILLPILLHSIILIIRFRIQSLQPFLIARCIHRILLGRILLKLHKIMIQAVDGSIPEEPTFITTQMV